MKNIQVSDFTLKAVLEQEIALSFKEKLLVAEYLDSARVDAIELPVLINTKENEIIYRTICSSVKNATVKIPVGDSIQSLRTVCEFVKNAHSFCLQVVMPVSTVQMEYFYHMKAPQMQTKIVELINEAKLLCNCVEFVAVDAFRADNEFIVDCAKIAYQAGACSITLCDSAGEAIPEDFYSLVKKIKDACGINVLVQPSNALHMAASCFVQAIKAGADGVKTSTVGNYLTMSVLSDIVRAKTFDLGVACGVDFTNGRSFGEKIFKLTELNDVEKHNQAHTENVITENSTLAEVGELIRQLGYELSDLDLGKVFDEVKKLASKKDIYGKELETIIASTAMQVPSTYHLVNYVVNSGNNIPATANVILEKDGEKFTGVSTGDGPIDAAFNAIEQIIGHHYELDDFKVYAATKGRGAVGSSIIRLRADGKLYSGNGASTDIIGACIRAYINALNKIVYGEK